MDPAALQPLLSARSPLSSLWLLRVPPPRCALLFPHPQVVSAGSQLPQGWESAGQTRPRSRQCCWAGQEARTLCCVPGAPNQPCRAFLRTLPRWVPRAAHGHSAESCGIGKASSSGGRTCLVRCQTGLGNLRAAPEIWVFPLGASSAVQGTPTRKELGWAEVLATAFEAGPLIPPSLPPFLQSFLGHRRSRRRC